MERVEEVNINKELVVNLVTLALRANNVVIQGNFPGSISDEVNALLAMCKEIHDEYVVVEGIEGRHDNKKA